MVDDQVAEDASFSREASAIDSAYKPFPSFVDWPSDVPREEAWDKRLAELNALEEGAEPPAIAHARRIALRAAAFDTGAIEGLYPTTRGITMTVARSEDVNWERAVPGAMLDVAALFGAQLATYERVTQEVEAGSVPANQAWIRELHASVAAAQENYSVQTPNGPRQQPLLRGEYKEHPNHVENSAGRMHAYAPVSETHSEMTRLVDELNSDAFANAHPVGQAAYAHYALAAIHPFSDGNGRVARALASAYLYRRGHIPFLVFADERPAYFEALEAADNGDALPFQLFVADAAVGSLALVADALRTAGAPSAEDAMRTYADLVTVQPGFTHTDLDSIAVTLLTAHVRAALVATAEAVNQTSGLSVSVGSGGGTIAGAPDGYRPVINGAQYLALAVQSQGPAAANQNATVSVYIAISRSADADQFWVVQDGVGDGAKLALREVHPSLTPAAEERVRLFVDRLLGRQVAAAVDEARANLIRAGYPDPT